MNSRRQFLALAATLGLIGALALGAGAVLAQDPTAPNAPAAVPPPVSGVGPAGLPTITIGGGGTTAAGSAIAYPYVGGAPGVAPDHTIVVTGVGQADMKSDGSDRAAAQKTAIGLALADAKTQAESVAAATGLSIIGVLSVSAAVSPSYGVMPMTANGSTTVCPPIEAPAKGSVLPQPVCPPFYQSTLQVSVTVAYRVG